MTKYLPAEWHPQACVQLTWPHAETDWAYILNEVETCYIEMAREISKREPLLVVANNKSNVDSLLRKSLTSEQMKQVTIVEMPTNDTWARDHGFISLLSDEGRTLLDFRFNGWGQKFASNFDNQINRRLHAYGTLDGKYENHLDFVLEGGSIESDGKGTILTTTECLTAPNRNEPLNQSDIEEELKKRLCAERVLWLDYGYLAGDDTDSHIDTLARLCPNDTIAYVQCKDASDEHYEQLQKMEQQLQTFVTKDGKPYRLIALPMAKAEYEDGERLPATYANFLIMNNAVLMPTYNNKVLDKLAKSKLAKAFPEHEIVGIDCRVLIRQHGSLHCCTMQYPAID